MTTYLRGLTLKRAALATIARATSGSRGGQA
jgi:hypothetical protein